jgi:hypothetical protein
MSEFFAVREQRRSREPLARENAGDFCSSKTPIPPTSLTQPFVFKNLVVSENYPVRHIRHSDSHKLFHAVASWSLATCTSVSSR